MEHGEFTVRGSLLDLFPMGSATPLRLDLFDDEIDTIRRFDPESQRSTSQLDAIDLLPAREYAIDADGIAKFRQAWRSRFEGDASACPIYRDVSQSVTPPGIEYYLPLFFEQTATAMDYLPQDALVVLAPGAHAAAVRYWDEITERFEQGRHDIERPLVPPTDMFVPVNDVFASLSAFPRIRAGKFEAEHANERTFASKAPISLPIDARSERPLALVQRHLDNFPGRTLFIAETAGRRETLLETFCGHGVSLAEFENWQDFVDDERAFGIVVAPLEAGTSLESPDIALIAEPQLFGARATQRRRRRRGTTTDAESVVRDLTELNVGAPVVHEDYGVGRYLGLETIAAGGSVNEFLCLEYDGNDKLYVPVASLHLVTRYTGADPETAPLHRLGSPQWQKAKSKAARRARDVAAELLDIYARRAARKGHAFELDAGPLRAFEQSFRFEETPDQQNAIEAVLADMQSPKPMDRLVCGDVGFGKTEVAMRAAFVAVHGGRQVAILVPTTLLAQQHHQSFSDRFADWPVRIEQLSRFRSKKERAEVVAGLADGKVDIVIGTHQVIQPDIKFKRLGLVVIDEEHRFGVRQKERLKALRTETDILTLTATPIPRTLNMSLSGLRDLSLIATPPQRRLSVKTFVREWNSTLLREALLREIRRGGQVFFVHNKVENIEKVAREVQELVPDALVQIAHGQMRERDLERTMIDFYHGRFNVLVCTTIIETGIDVPSANTIIINRADHFGLAQLHQLRGRVGRSHHRAYAYLVVPPRRTMSADAVRRLEAIESLEDLGIGFTLATHDLEIRGAGELLGDGQSGQIHEVGYSLYRDLLERAVEALKAGRTPDLDRPLDHGAEIDLHAPALIPEDYLPDVHTRLIMYKRIASARDEEQLLALSEEMVDRFGRLPDATRTLFNVTRIKLKATPLGVVKVDIGQRGGRILFGAEPNVDPGNVIRLIQSQPTHFKLDGPDRIRVSMDLPGANERVELLSELIDSLSARAAA
jgi:transcription-repair coupling factor (superfamily II helicase)